MLLEALEPRVLLAADHDPLLSTALKSQSSFYATCGVDSVVVDISRAGRLAQLDAFGPDSSLTGLSSALQPESAILFGQYRPLLGSGITGQGFYGQIEEGATDETSIALEAGVTVTFAVFPQQRSGRDPADPPMRLSLEVLDPHGDVVLSATTGSPGERTATNLFAVTEAGNYLFRVTALEGSGEFFADAFLNTMIEPEPGAYRPLAEGAVFTKSVPLEMGTSLSFTAYPFDRGGQVPPDLPMRLSAELLDPNGAVIASSVSTEAGTAVTVNTVRIATSGQYTLRITNLEGRGGMVINTVQTVDLEPGATPLPGGGERLSVLGNVDIYSTDRHTFDASAGELISIAVNSNDEFSNEPAPIVRVLDPDGIEIAAGVENALSAGITIPNIVAQKSGAYTVTLSAREPVPGGYTSINYALLVTKGAIFETDRGDLAAAGLYAGSAGQGGTPREVTFNTPWVGPSGIAVGGSNGGRSATRVAVVGSEAVNDLVTQINNLGAGPFEARRVTGADIDTVEELEQFDVVLLTGESQGDAVLRENIGLIRDWVRDSGRALVTTGSGIYLDGYAYSADFDEVAAIQLSARVTADVVSSVSTASGSHPILANFTQDFSLFGAAFQGLPDPDADVAATAPDGRALVVAKQVGLGRSVHLAYEFGSPGQPGTLRQDAGSRLLGQALLWAQGNKTWDNFDDYIIAVNPGDAVDLSVVRLGAEPGLPDTDLSVELELMRADGSQIAFGAGPEPLVNYVASDAETLIVRVRTSGTGGYQLQVTGATGTPPLVASTPIPVQVSASEVVPAYVGWGPLIRQVDTEFRVDFSAPLDLQTVSASVLLLDGEAASAVRVVDGDTLVFTLPVAPADGEHTIEIAGGILKSVDGRVFGGRFIPFTLDSTPPRVITSSIAPNEVLDADPFTIAVGFSEEMNAGLIDSVYDASLFNLDTQTFEAISTLTYNPGTRTLTATTDAALEEADYQFYLHGDIRDPAGNRLDGFPNDQVPTGDGTEDGFWFLPFSVRNLTTEIAALPALSPPGGQVYATTLERSLPRGDIDTFEITLEAGARLSVGFSPKGQLAAEVAIVDSGGSVVASAAAANPGDALTLPPGALAAGVYSVRVTNIAGTGRYALTLALNAVIAAEGGAVDDGTAAGAVNLEPSATTFGASATRLGGVGDLAGSGDVDRFTLDLEAGQRIDLGLGGIDGDVGRLRATLMDDSGTEVATSAAGPDGLQRIDGFVARAAGTYQIRIETRPGAPADAATLRYALAVTRDAQLAVGGAENAPVTAGTLFGRTGSVGAAGPALRVAVHGLDANAVALRNQLNDSSVFSFNAVAVDGSDLDTLDELLAYDVVVIGNSAAGNQLDSMATALKQYVLGGGGLIATGYSVNVAGTDTGSALQAIDDIVPVNTSGSATFLNGFSLYPNATAHPITQGVIPFYFGSGEVPNGGVDPGATLLASDFSGTRPMLVIDTRGSGRTVYTGIAYASVGDPVLRSGQPDKLLEQAVAWVARPGDSYVVELAAGQTVSFTTQTPFTAPGEPLTALNPALTVTGPNGQVVASNSSSPSGALDAQVEFTAAVAGRYQVRVSSEAGRGDYVLTTNAPVAALPFTVTSASVANGASLRNAPSELRLTLSDNVYLPSVEAGDLTINGVAAHAVTIVDGRTLVFDIAGLADAEGSYAIALAAGRLDDAGGTAVTAFASAFRVDRTPPTVVSITPDGLTAPLNVVTVTMSEAVDAASVSAGDLRIVDPNGAVITPFAVTVAGNVLTFRLFNNFVAGSYGVTFGPAITDLTGNAMTAAMSDTIVVVSPDLVVTGVSTVASAVFGNVISVTYTVQNVGNAPVFGQWLDYLFLSTDPLKGYDPATNSFDQTIQSTLITQFTSATPLGIGESYTRTVNATLPYVSTSYQPGSYYVLATTNNNQGTSQSVGESSYNNNTRATTPVSLTLPPSPDLEVRAISVPGAAFFGQTVTINWTDFNAGTGDATGSWTDQVWFSADNYLDTGFFTDDWLLHTSIVDRSTNPLAPGQGIDRSATITLPFNGASDPNRTYTIFVVTDRTNAIYEHQAEDDNTVPLPINLALPPLLDLRVDATSVSDITPEFGNTVDVTYTVTNHGSGTVTGSWTDQISLTVRPQGYGTLSLRNEPVTGVTLAPGQSYTRTVSVTLPLNHSYDPGQWGIQVQTDAFRQIFEYQADDNNDGPNIDVTIADPPLPDLRVTTVAAPPAAEFGRNIAFSYTVSNLGNGPTTAVWTDLVYLSLGNATIDNRDRLLWSGPSLRPLAAGESYTRTLDIPLPLDPSVLAGGYSIIVVADQQNQFGQSAVYESEANETNNQGSDALSVTIRTLPDLQVSALTSPIEAISGQLVPISWTILNTGTEAVANWTDRVYLSTDAVLDGSDLQLGADVRFEGTLGVGQSVRQTVDFTLPETLSGSRYVIIKTDATEEYYEYPNEANNVRAAASPTSIVLKDFPNLQVSALTVPADAASSQPIDIVWRVTNAGTGPTTVPVWRDYVYLSTDDVVNAGDVLLGIAENPSFLAPGASYENRLTAILPRGIEGVWKVIVVADRENRIFEFGGETDNQRLAPVNVALTPPPNLQVTSVSAPLTAVTGDPMAVSVTITNVGGARTFESAWDDRIFISADTTLDAGDTLLSTVRHTGALDNGASYTLSTSVLPPIGQAGRFYVFVRTDASGEVFEGANEGDNTGFDATPTTIVHRPPPDLVTVVTGAPSSALAGQAINLAFSVRNDGSTATPQSSWFNAIYLSEDGVLGPDDILLDSYLQQPGPVQPGQAAATGRTVRLPTGISGDFHLIIASDSANEVFEFDNANNIVASALRIDDRPADLTVPLVSVPENGIAGRQIAVNWTITNTGAGPTDNGLWNNRIILSRNQTYGDGDDIVLRDVETTATLAAGASIAQSAFVTLPYEADGDYFILVQTDTDSNRNRRVDESDEANNTGSAPITVTRSIADLRVTSVNAPLAAIAGQPVAVSWTVINDGNADANATTWIDRVYISADGAYDIGDAYIGAVRRTNTLAPGASYTASGNFVLPATLPTGSYRIIVFTDRDNSVTETPFESNNATASNQLAVSGYAPPVPNLVMSIVDAPDTAVSGQTVTLRYTVTNTGDTFTGAWYDSLFLSADQNLQRASDVFLGYVTQQRTLAAGESYQQEFVATIPKGYAGPYYFFVSTDSTNLVSTESSETDNAGYDGLSTLVVLPTPTDLIVGSVVIPETLTLGAEASIRYTISNASAGTALGSWYDAVYLSGDGVWDVGDRLVGRVLHTGPVAAGASYSETLVAQIPGVLPGSYQVIVRTDIRNNLDEANEANNIGGSLDAASVDVPTLAVGASVAGSIPANGISYYRLVANAGETLRLFLDGAAGAVGNEIYVSYGAVPERGLGDFSAATPFEADQELIIPTSRAGVYYIAVVNTDAAAASAFTLSAESIPFSIRSIARNTVGNANDATIRIEGARFEPGTRFSLLNDLGEALDASRVVIVNASRAYATFDLFGTPAGRYDLAALSPSGAAVALTDGLTITEGVGSNIADAVNGPSAVRGRTINSVTYLWTNNGDADTAAPLIRVKPTGGTFGYDPQRMREGLFLALGSSTEGPSDVLRPGGESAMSFVFYAGARMEFDTVGEDSGEPITDWGAIRDALKPNALADAQWLPFWNRIQPEIGDEWGDLAAFINRIALDVAEPGEALRDIHLIFERLYVKSPDFRVTVSASGVLLDSQTNAPLAGTTIFAYRVAHNDQVLGGIGVTDANGAFTIAGLEPGEYFFGLDPSLRLVFDANSDGIADTTRTTLIVGDTDDVIGLTLRATDEIAQNDLTQVTRPILMTDPDGEDHIFWLEDGKLWHARFDGASWVDAVMLADAVDQEFTVSAASNLIDGSTPGIILVWRTASAEANTRDFNYSIGVKTANGMSWSRFERLVDNAVDDSLASIAIDPDGRVIVAYRSTDGTINDDGDLYFRVIDVDGSVLSFSAESLAAARQVEMEIERQINKMVESGVLIPDGLQGADGKVKYEKKFKVPKLPFLGVSGGLAVNVNGSYDETKTAINASAGGSIKITFGKEDAGGAPAIVPGSDGSFASGTETQFFVEGSGTYSAGWVAKGCETPTWELASSKLELSLGGGVEVKIPLENLVPRNTPQGFAIATALEEAKKTLKLGGVLFGLSISVSLTGSMSWSADAPPVLLRLPDEGITKAQLRVKPSVSVFAGGDSLDNAAVSATLSGDLAITWQILPTFEFQGAAGTAKLSLSAPVLGYFKEIPVASTTFFGVSSASSSELTSLAENVPTMTIRRDLSVLAGSSGDYSGGGAQAIETNVAGNLAYDGKPELATAPDGTIYAVWQSADASDPTQRFLKFAHYVAGAWSTPEAIPGTDRAIGGASIAFDATGRLVLLWSDRGNALVPVLEEGIASEETITALTAYERTAELKSSVFENGLWSVPVTVADLSGQENGMELGRVGDVLLGAWRREIMDSDMVEIYVAAWDSVTGTWGAATKVGEGDGALAISIGKVGNSAAIFWSEDRRPGDDLKEMEVRWVRLGESAWSQEQAFAPSLLANRVAPDLAALAAELSGSGSVLEAVGALVPTDARADNYFGPPEKDPNEICEEKEKPKTIFAPAVIGSIDPNDIIGPKGTGEENWITAENPLSYMIRFENRASATAPAQTVSIVQKLDPDLDIRTFRVDDFGWSGEVFAQNADRAYFLGRIDLTATKGYVVELLVLPDVTANTLTWLFTTIDPATGEPTSDARAGFLPPNDGDGLGEGFVTYTIRPKAGVPTGTRIDAMATIIFDTEEPIDTPAIFNTLDAVKPDATMLPLPATSDATTIELQWGGLDDVNGSAIASYSIYFSRDGGELSLFRLDTTETSGLFVGEAGSTYAFYAVARDHAGNQEAIPATPDTTIGIGGLAPGSISGRVFNDSDGDGLLDAGEGPRSGLTVFLDADADGLFDAGEASAVTDAAGLYGFAALAPGAYRIGFVIPAGDVATTPAFNVVTVTPSADTLAPAFGLFTPATISGVAFSDLDQDGLRDAGETGLAGRTIFLDSDDDGVLDDGERTAVTGSDGSYSFAGLSAGVVVLRQVVPAHVAASGPDRLVVTVTSGLVADNRNFGSIALARIAGVKFEDVNGNGAREAGEALLPGWTVFLDQDLDGLLDAGERVTVTDAAGGYVFEDVRPGAYVVAEVLKPGWRQTYPAPGSATAPGLLDTAASAVQLVSPDMMVAGTTPLAAGDSIRASLLTGLDAYRADPRFAGTEGAGIRVVTIDTGIDRDSAFFGPDRDGNGVSDRIVFQWDFADNDADASDRTGHGSNVASIIASSDGTYAGVAPAADIIALKVFQDNGAGYFLYVEKALQWVVSHAGDFGVGVVNLSLGDGGNWLTSASRYGLGDELAALAAQGIIITAASGNAFYTFDAQPGVSYPAADPNVIAVGAVWSADYGGPWRFSNGAADLTTAGDAIASFSQRGGLTDIFAPGARLTGANATGGTVTMQGTSQASAYLAGVAALAQDIALDHLGRRLSGAEFAALSRQTGIVIIDGDDENDNVDNTGDSYRRVNVKALAEAILAMTPGSGSGGTGGGDTGGGSDAVPRALDGHALTIGVGDNLANVDFGNFNLGRVTGQVFDDLDGDGVLDAGESGLGGRTVFVDRDNNGVLDAGEATAVTDAGGAFSFVDLGPGAVTVRQVVPAGSVATSSAFSAAIVSGSNLTASFGSFGLGRVSGQVFDDRDADGVQDAGETGIAGRTVFIDLDNDGVLDSGETSTATGLSGAWSFAGLGAGSITIRQVVPAGSVATSGAFSATVVSGATLAASFGVRDLPPVTAADSYAVDAGGTLTVSAAQGVLANDNDPGAGALTATLVNGPLHGTLTLGTDGGFVYRPTPGYSGSDSFLYAARDSAGNLTQALAAITIRPVIVNRPPVAVADEAAVSEDATVVIDVRRNDSDAETARNLLVVGLTSPLSALGAALSVDAGGRVVYDPRQASALQALNFGEVATDSFTYAITDGGGAAATATVTVRVNGRNDTTVELVAQTSEDVAFTLPVDGLTVISASSRNALVSILPEGLRYDPTRSATLQALTSAPGSALVDKVTFTARDGDGKLVLGQVIVTVTGADDRPVAGSLTVATDADMTIAVDALALARDPDQGAVLTLQSFDAASSLGGTIRLVAGQLVYDPTSSVALAGLFSGQTRTDSFAYTVTDETGRTATGSVRVIVSGRQEAAIVDFPVRATDEDTLLTFRPAAGLVVIGANAKSSEGADVQVIANGSLRYDPRRAAGLQALNVGQTAADAILFTYKDSGGALRLGRVVLNVAGINEPLALRNDSASSGNLAPAAIDVLRNDVAPEGATLATGPLSSLGASLAVVDGKITYDPTGSALLSRLAVGQVVSDSFTYSVASNGTTATATVTVRVTGRNTPPVAVVDRVETAADQAILFNPAANDTDAQNSPIAIQSVAARSALGAAVALQADGSVRYNPTGVAGFIKLRSGETLVDSFTYVIADEQGAIARGQVFVTVTGVNDAPVAANDSAAAFDNAVANINVLANDRDTDEIAPLSVTVAGTSVRGASLVVLPDGRIAYDPRAVLQGLALGETLADTFSYTVTDALGLTSTATVSVLVKGRNAGPVAVADAITLVAGAAGRINVLANDRDIDTGAVLSLSRLDAASRLGATLTLNADGSVRYDAGSSAVLSALAPGQSRTDRFAYTVSDEHGALSTATVTVTVFGAGSTPPAAAGSSPISVDLGRVLEGFSMASVSSGGAWKESFVAGSAPAADPNAGIRITLG